MTKTTTPKPSEVKIDSAHLPNAGKNTYINIDDKKEKSAENVERATKIFIIEKMVGHEVMNGWLHDAIQLFEFVASQDRQNHPNIYERTQ